MERRRYPTTKFKVSAHIWGETKASQGGRPQATIPAWLRCDPRAQLSPGQPEQLQCHGRMEPGQSPSHLRHAALFPEPAGLARPQGAAYPCRAPWAPSGPQDCGRDGFGNMLLGFLISEDI